jgi:cytochrome P450
VDAERLIPPRIDPPATAPKGLAFIAAFARNPLQVMPAAAYEEDFVPLGGPGASRYWVTSPALIKSVLLDQREVFRKLTQVRLLGPMLGRGILTSEGAHWKWQRQASAPMFRPQELGGFVPAFVGAAQDLVATWRAQPGVRRIDEDMTRTTFDVVRATLLRSSDETLGPTIERAIRAMQVSGGWEMLVASLNLPRWIPRPGMFRGRNAVASLRGAVGAMVRERHAASDDAPQDLMHRLIAARDPESGQAMDDEQLIDNLLTFYLAGHETTAKVLTWTLYLLARSPQWTAAVHEEIDRVTLGAPVEAAHIDRLVLIQQVLKEAMRLYPPVPMMSRQAVADTQIGEHAIPSGASILMPIYVIHRHARRWESPDVFDPTRFAAGNEDAIPRYQYMPFGAGPRICIGMSFALMESTAMLATFLRHARFETVAGHDPTPVARVTLMPKGGMPMKVTPA